MSSREEYIDLANAKDILFLAKKIEKYSNPYSNGKTLYENAQAFDACLMNFVAIGEAVSRISNDFKETHAQIEWNGIKRFRNMIAHQYFGIDYDEVWEIVENYVPDLIFKLETILSDE
ncbi:MAG: HepT-like ribonuclease domain-containing protein [Bacteroidia bacterium]